MSSYPLPVSDYYTYDQYLEINDAATSVKYEYFYGKIYAMAGGSFHHNLIKDNICEHIRPRLRGQCFVMTSDMQLKLADDFTAYPDVMIICEKPEFLIHRGKERKDIVTRAAAVFEVLSKTTKDYDRGDKAEAYRSEPGLHEFFLVDQEKYHVTHHYRYGDKWHSIIYDSIADEVDFKSLSCTLSLREIYLDVEE